MIESIEATRKKDKEIITNIFTHFKIDPNSERYPEIKISELKKIFPDLKQSKLSGIRKILLESDHEVVTDLLDGKCTINKAVRKLKGDKKLLTPEIFLENYKKTLSQSIRRNRYGELLDIQVSEIKTCVRITMYLYNSGYLAENHMTYFIKILNDEICSNVPPSKKDSLKEAVEEYDCEIHVIKAAKDCYEYIFTKRNTGEAE